jgi:aminoglycoside phosphotransferase family enzyme/predicted kinase
MSSTGQSSKRCVDLGAPDQERLVAALAHSGVLGSVSVLETHISYVLLTGRHAYKIKKAVDLGFLDFTTLSARKHFCDEELRLNRRLARDLYLDVVAITGSVDAPAISGEGPVLEYAVRMREFPQEALASELLVRDELSASDIDELAMQVAAFHTSVAVAPSDDRFGTPETIRKVAQQNFPVIRALMNAPSERAATEALASWTERECLARRATFRARLLNGFVRECHGDLHLGNIARVDGKLTIFDCVEFNETMRWIDVMSEVAFFVMDLHDRKRPDLAQRFLNAYLETTGDYAGLAVLRFYLVYRAMVRAKIHCLRAAQLDPGTARSNAVAEYRGYAELARSFTRMQRPAIILMHGVSGCGKTTRSQVLLEVTGAVRIRSDVERKRLHGLAPLERGIEQNLYGSAATDATYRRLCVLTREVVSAGFVAIVDAAFLQRWQRDLFRALATDLQVPFAIVTFIASEATLRERVGARAAAGRDASDANAAILEQQLRTQQPLAEDECTDIVVLDAEEPLERAREPGAWGSVLERIAGEGARGERTQPRQ